MSIWELKKIEEMLKSFQRQMARAVKARQPHGGEIHTELLPSASRREAQQTETVNTSAFLLVMKDYASGVVLDALNLE